MTHAVLVQNSVVAKNIDAYQRSAIAGSSIDIDNGNVFRLDSVSTTSGESEVWSVTAPSLSGSTLDELWMAYEPEIVDAYAGTNVYRGLDADPRNFYNKGDNVFSAFKPQIGDIVTLTADALTGTKSTNEYVNASDGVYTLAWGASQTSSALSLKLLATTYVSIADGSIGNQRVTAYKFVVVGN